jgi:hypothetical protein
MSRVLVWCGGVAGAIGVAALWRFQMAQSDEAVFNPPLREVESAPLCPWREPASDLQFFFRREVQSESQTVILSHLRVELTKHLGRLPEPHENALTLHRIRAGEEHLGAVLTRRVKGEHGSIELVVAIDWQGAVHGVRLQRLREPEAIARHIRDENWLARFCGRTHDRGWDSRDEIEALPENLRLSAQAIREGVRSLLILYAAARGSYSDPEAKPARAA